MKIIFMSSEDELEGAERGHDLRCACGALLARLLATRVVLKCRRCKRVLAIELGAPAPSCAHREPSP